jgi:putative membrane protein insertion efficiency factor
MQFLWTTLKDLPALLLIAVVRVYQLLISPWLGPTCRYTPSCSNYMIEAVHKYGFWRGAWRGMRRIARCHPFRAGGYDPP